MNNTMKYEIKLKNLLSGKTTTTSPDYPLFNHESYKIQVSINDENYTQTYRRSVRWDFGDGTVVESPSAIHYYKEPGHYKIRCTLYRANRVTVENDVQPIEVFVKEVIPTELSFIDPSSWSVGKKPISKNNCLGSLQVTIGPNIVSEPKISAYQSNDNEQQSYFDICNESYYHLKRYWTFLQEETVYYSNGEYAKTLLKPTQSYRPEYIPIYGRFIYSIAGIKLEAFVVTPENNINFKKCKLEPYDTKFLDGTRIKNFEIGRKDKMSELPEGCSIIGKFATTNIWYKNDNHSKNKLFFELKRDTIQLSSQPVSAGNYLNIPPLGLELETTEDISENFIEQITPNGIYDGISTGTFSNFLKHNFYKNRTVEGYLAEFIQNDELNGETSFNIIKYTNRRPEGLITASKYDETGCEVSLKEIGDYYLHYEFTPFESNFIIQGSDGQPLYQHGKLIDLDEMVLPSEKICDENIDELLNTYMQHPMYESAHNVKKFLHDIFSHKDNLSYLISKGTNFIDDNVNYKTCYVDKLLSILEMLDTSVSRYDVAAFEKVNDLRDLTRILTMNYSHLFGTVIENEYDIEATGSYKGKNIGDKVEVKDTILCNKNYEIIGFRKGSNIYKLSAPSPFIVIKDNITSKTYLASFHNIKSIEFEEFTDQTEDWKTKNKDFANQVEYSYRIGDYDYTWGWSLNLPENAQKSVYKSEQIAAAYSFFIFVPVVEKKRRYNFISEDTIPYSEENSKEQITVEEWNKDFGFVYDCLMKVLTQNLK